MGLSRRGLRATARAVLLALLATLLLPAVARAVQGPEPGAWAEVCTAQGTAWQRVDGGTGPGATLHEAWEHCPWCHKLDGAPSAVQAAAPGPWPEAAALAAAADAAPAGCGASALRPPTRGPPAAPLH